MGGPRQVRDARPDFRPPDFKQGGRACDWAASGTAAARALGQHPPTVIAPGLGGAPGPGPRPAAAVGANCNVVSAQAGLK